MDDVKLLKMLTTVLMNQSAIASELAMIHLRLGGEKDKCMQFMNEVNQRSIKAMGGTG